MFLTITMQLPFMWSSAAILNFETLHGLRIEVDGQWISRVQVYLPRGDICKDSHPCLNKRERAERVMAWWGKAQHVRSENHRLRDLKLMGFVLKTISERMPASQWDCFLTSGTSHVVTLNEHWLYIASIHLATSRCLFNFYLVKLLQWRLSHASTPNCQSRVAFVILCAYLWGELFGKSLHLQRLVAAQPWMFRPNDLQEAEQAAAKQAFEELQNDIKWSLPIFSKSDAFLSHTFQQMDPASPNHWNLEWNSAGPGEG